MPETLEQRRRRQRVANGEYPYYMDEYHAFSELFRMLLEFLASLFSGNTPGNNGASASAAAAAPTTQQSVPAANVPTRFPATQTPTATVANTLPVLDTTANPAPGLTPSKPKI